MKEKIDRQLAGQNSSTLFMSIRDNCRKRVIFDMTDDIEQKIDKLMLMMGKLVTEDKGKNKPFKPWVYQSNRDRGQNRGNYQGSYRGHSRYNQNFRGRMTYSPNNRGSYGYNTWGNQRYGRYNNYGKGGNGDQLIIEEEVGHLKDRIEGGEMTEVGVTVGPGQVLGQVQIETEFDALCVESMISRETEQMQ